MDEVKQWTYSHSQLSKYRDCPRLYHDEYVLGFKQPKTPNMAFGSYMLHEPIEEYVRQQPHFKGLDGDQWAMWWANFLAEFGGTNDYDDPVLTLKTGRKCLELYQKSPIEGDVFVVENRKKKAGRFYYTFPDGIRYVSIPDFIVGRKDPIYNSRFDDFDFSRKRLTVDLKFTQTWKVNPLLPYDDQCLGQAICAGADGFIRCTFKADKKTGKVTGPQIEEHLIDPILRDEWISETWRKCREIESMKRLPGATWDKNDGHCYAYGRECHRINFCKNGATMHG